MTPDLFRRPLAAFSGFLLLASALVFLPAPPALALGQVTIEFSTDTGSLDETGPGTLVVDVVATAAGGGTLDEDVVIDVNILGSSSATEGLAEDFTRDVTQVSFGSTDVSPATRQVTFTAVDDTLAEGDETIDLDLSIFSATGTAALGTQATFAITLNDDEATPIVGFAAAGSTVAETGIPQDISVSIDIGAATDLGQSVTVDVVDTTNGTAADTDDFTYTTTGVTFVPGDLTPKTVTITPVDDPNVEADETVILDFDDPSLIGPAVLDPGDHTVTIQSEDVATISFDSPTASVGEAAGATTVAATISLPGGGALETTVSAPVNVTGGTATGTGTDYTYTPASVTWVGPDVAGKSVPVTIVDDLLVEGSEDVVFGFGAPSAEAQVGGTTATTLTIADDETATLAFATSSSSVAEDDVTAHTVSVVLTTPAGATLAADVTVEVADQGSGSAEAADYTFTTPETLTFPAGSGDGTLRTVTITQQPDTLVEGDETIALVLQNETGASAISGIAAHTVTLTDSEAAATVQFVAAGSNPGESVGGHGVTARLDLPVGATALGQAVTVDVTDATAGTADSGTDYDPIGTQTLTFGVGSIDGETRNATVTVTDDANVEDDETINLSLANPGGPATLGLAAHTVTVDSEDVATVGFTASASATGDEAAAPHLVGLTLSIAGGGVLEIPVTADVTDSGGGTASSGTDYTAIGTKTATFTIGSGTGATANVSVDILSDLVVEGNETINLAVGNPSAEATVGGTTAHTVTITDDESAPTVAFLGSTSNPTEDQLTDHTVVVQLTVPGGGTLGSTVTVQVADLGTGSATSGGGNDYTFTSPTTVTFAAGRSDGDTETVTVAQLQDTLVEGDETIDLALQSPTGGASLGAIQNHEVTLSDGESEALVAYSVAASTAAEAGGAHTVVVELQLPPGATALGQPVSIDTTDLGGTVEPGDYSFTPGTVTFGVGATDGATQNLSVTPTNDANVEDDETVTVGFTNPAGYVSAGLIDTHAVTITSEDVAALTFETPSSAVGEGSVSPLTVNVVLGLPPGGNLETTVTADVRDNGLGSATAGSDYSTFGTAQVSFIAGSPDGAIDSVAITPTDDGLAEGNETVQLVLENPSAFASASGTHTATITDDEGVPVVSIADDSATEGASLAIPVSMTTASGGDVTVSFTVTPGTATVIDDYSNPVLSVTIPTGSTSATITIVTVPESLFEADETLTVALASVTAGAATIAAGPNDTATGTILNDDAPPVMSMQTPGPTAGEADGVLTFTVELNAASGLDASAGVDTIGGSATPGADFAPLSSTVTVPAGATSATFDVSILDDQIDEPDETVQVQLSSPSNATLGAATRSGTITDNDAAGVTITPTALTVVEGAAGLSYTVELTSEPTADVDISVTSSDPAEATVDTALLTFTPLNWDTAQPVTVTAVDDAVADGTTTSTSVDHVVTSGDGNYNNFVTDSVAVTVNDNESAPTLVISDVTVDENDAGGELVFLVTLTPASGSTVTVDFATADGSATAGADYAAVAAGLPDGQLTFGPGQTNRNARVPLLDDVFDEIDETLTVTLSNQSPGVTITDGTATGTITDDDPEPALSLNTPTASEAAGTLDFTVTLAPASGKTVTVTAATTDVGSATSGTDFTPVTQVLTFTPGQTTKTVSVPITNDALNEATEDVQMTLTLANNAAIATAASFGDITDNDPLPTVSVVGDAGGEGAGTLDITVSLNTPSGRPTNVTLNTDDVTATAGSDYTDIVDRLVQFAAGETSKTITVDILEDDIDETAESFNAVLTAPTFATLGTATAAVTINDNDTANVVVSTTALTVAEGAAGLDYTVVLGSEPTATVTVAIGVSDGQATVNKASLTFTPGNWDTAQTVTVTAVDDAVAEGTTASTTIDHTVTSGDANYNNFATGSIAVTVTDNETTPVVNIAGAGVTEGPTAELVFAVSLSGESAGAVQVTWSAAAGSATAVDDFTPASGTLVFPAGALNRSARITVVDDALDEFDETVIVTLTGVTVGDATLGTTTATGTIVDDDAEPSLALNTPTASETDGTLDFVVTLSAPSGKTVTVTAETGGGGDATAGADFTAVGPTVRTFTPGQTTKTIAVPIIDDSLDELTETVQMTLIDATNATIATAARLGDITDDDPPVGISAGNVSIVEGDAGTKTLTFTVSLSAVSGRNVAVDVATADISANAGSDYVAVASTRLQFAPGTTSLPVDVTILGDVTAEGDETFELLLSNAANGSITTPSAIGTIQDNEGPPIVNIAPATVEEAPGAELVFLVTLSGESAETIQVTWVATAGSATEGADFTAASGTLSFPPGSLNRNARVTVLDDALDEFDETVTVTLTGIAAGDATIGTSAETGTITDDDPEPSLSLNTPTVAENAGPMVFTITLSAASGKTVTVNAATTAVGSATPGTDFVPRSAVVTFNPGETSKTVGVSITDDGLDEPAETVQMTLTNASNASIATAVRSGTITDDDDPVAVSVAGVTVSEAAGSASVIISLSGPSGRNVGITATTSNGSATAGADYTATSQTFTFAPGEVTKTLVVPITNDVIDENNETFTVTLSGETNATIGTATATVTITDDDTAGITVSPTALTVAEGAAGVAYSVVLLTEPTANVVVTVGLPGGEATASPGSLTFTPANWDEAQNVTVTAVDDAVSDGTKSATASHTVTSGDLKYDGVSASSVAVTVTDNEASPTISIADAGAVEADAAAVAMVFDVSIAPASASDITVDYLTTAGSATANVDYTQVPATQLLIPAGATTATISIDVLPDNLAEAPEEFTVTLTNVGPGAGIGTSLATGTITDDDDAPDGVADNYTVDEGGVLPTFNVLANDVDDDDTALTAVLVDAPTYAGVFNLASDGTLTYEHDGSEAPTDSFTYQVGDGTNLSAATTVTITVTPVNDVPVVDAGGDLSVDEGDTVALPPATFTDPDPGDTHTATVDWGDGTALDTATVDEDANTVDATHVYADNGTFPVSVDVLDSATPAGQGSASFDVNVSNVAPTAVVAGAPATSPEGTPISLTATADDPGTADTHTFVWSVTKNGSAYASDTTSAIDFTPDDEGTYVLSVVATDDDGADSAPTSVTIDVTNVAPTVTPPADPTIIEGAVFTSAAGIADPGILDTFTATVDWGEGAGPEAVTAGTDVPLVHQFIEDGVYSVTICVDDGTDETCEVITVTVTNAPAVIGVATATPAAITEGDTITLEVSFTDPGASDTHTAVVDWGDGATTPLDPVTSPFSLDHTYVDEGVAGSFTIVITVTDDDGAVATRNVVVTVTNSDLLVDADSTGESINEGESVAFSVDITDAGVVDTHTAVINWGDGTADTDLGSVARTFDTGSHVFAQDGTYSVLITVTDNGGDVGTTSVPVTVANLAPVAAALTPVTIEEGTTFVASGTFTDPGTEDTFTGTVNYGDGTPVGPLTLGSGTFDLSHPYADNGVFTVTVCITDEAEATGCSAANVTVTNVNPTASVSGPLAATPPFLEGTSLDFTAPASDVPGDPLTFAWSVDLGDETVAAGTGVNFTFTPADNGEFTVTVVVSDDDGGSTTASVPVTVVNVAPLGQITRLGGGLPLTTRNEGSLIELVGTEVDPGADTFTYAWTVTKNGAPYRTGASRTFTFRPDDEGQYVVELVITDDDGGSSGTLSYELTALNVKPAPTILGTTGAVEGQTVLLSAEANDPGPLDVAVYSWEVRLQGQLFASGSTPTLSFLPADNGVYFVSVVVSDDDPNDPSDDAVAGVGAQAVLVIVENAAPVITSLNTNTAPRFGAPVPLAVSFTDGGAGDVHSGQVNWGDGTAVEALVITESNGSGSAATFHTFPDRGSYTAEICIFDDDLGQVCETIVYAVGAVLDLSSDYNGDGRDDLAIGVPGETISGATGAGAVNVLFGRRVGIGSGPDDFIHQDDSNVPSAAQKNDAFGSAIASGDFNGDGFSDLAVSSPGETLGDAGRTGTVTVFNGSAAGISRENIQWWHQGLPEIPGDQGTRDYFGATLATGDFNGDNFADLAIGVTGEDVGSATDAGRVVVLYGSPLGLAGPADSWDQNSPGVKNVAQSGDTFGASLTTGDFDGDGYWDLAIGVPFEDINAQVDAGAVNVIRGSASGLVSLNDAFLHQDSDGVDNVAEANDNFGAAVAAGDFNGDGFDDLSVGVPGESYSGTVHAGAVAVLRGRATGLSGINDQFFVAGSSLLPGSARANARFGSSLAAADFTGNGKSDLAIGTPGDLVSGKNAAGSVTHLKGLAAGLTTKRAKRFTEASPGLEGEPFGNDQFGATLRAGNFDGDNDWDLAVGIPNQNVGGAANAGAVMVLRSRRTGIVTQADTLWTQNTNGVKDIAEAGDGFGRGL